MRVKSTFVYLLISSFLLNQFGLALAHTSAGGATSERQQIEKLARQTSKPLTEAEIRQVARTLVDDPQLRVQFSEFTDIEVKLEAAIKEFNRICRTPGQKILTRYEILDLDRIHRDQESISCHNEAVRLGHWVDLQAKGLTLIEAPSSQCVDCGRNQQNDILSSSGHSGSNLAQVVNQVNGAMACPGEGAVAFRNSCEGNAVLGKMQGLNAAHDVHCQKQSSFGADITGCLAGLLEGMWKNIIEFNLKFLLWDMPVGFAKGAWGVLSHPAATAKAVSGAVQGAVAKVKSWGAVKKVDDAAADKALAARGIDQETIDLMKKDPEKAKKNIFARMTDSIFNFTSHFIAEHFGCEKWAGVPEVSKCVKPGTTWKCASNEKKAQMACGVLGFFGGQAAFMLATGGLGSFASVAKELGAVKMAAMTAKVAEVSGLGGAVGRGALQVAKGVAKAGSTYYRTVETIYNAPFWLAGKALSPLGKVLQKIASRGGGTVEKEAVAHSAAELHSYARDPKIPLTEVAVEDATKAESRTGNAQVILKQNGPTLSGFSQTMLNAGQAVAKLHGALTEGGTKLAATLGEKTLGKDITDRALSNISTRQAEAADKVMRAQFAKASTDVENTGKAYVEARTAYEDVLEKSKDQPGLSREVKKKKAVLDKADSDYETALYRHDDLKGAFEKTALTHQETSAPVPAAARDVASSIEPKQVPLVAEASKVYQVDLEAAKLPRDAAGNLEPKSLENYKAQVEKLGGTDVKLVKDPETGEDVLQFNNNKCTPPGMSLRTRL